MGVMISTTIMCKRPIGHHLSIYEAFLFDTHAVLDCKLVDRFRYLDEVESIYSGSVA